MKTVIKLHQQSSLAHVPELAKQAAADLGISLSATLSAVNAVSRSSYLQDTNFKKLCNIRKPGPQVVCTAVNLLIALGIEVEIELLSHTPPVLVTSIIPPASWSKLLGKDANAAAEAVVEIRTLSGK